MTIAEHAPRIASALAAAVLLARSRHRPPLRPLAACLCLVAALDAARALVPPRSLDVALYAAWYVAQALAVGVGLFACNADDEDKPC